jgi:hypothetical protein
LWCIAGMRTLLVSLLGLKWLIREFRDAIAQ